jgi:hypothetical protein
VLMNDDQQSDLVARQHQTEQFNHALYGLIIVTAALVAERLHVTEPLEALAILLSTGLVLFLAHTYSEALAVRAVERHKLGVTGRRMVVIDNAPVVAAIVVPSLLFVLAQLDVLTLRVAYAISIVFSLGALIAHGAYQGWLASNHKGQAALYGALAGGLGILVIAIEVVLD